MTAQLPIATETASMVLQLQPAVVLTDEQFFELCQQNRDVQIERNAQGNLVIMPPTGSETDERNFNLIGQLWAWGQQDGSGVGFGSSGGFRLPNGAVRSPDAAWILKSRWEEISPSQRQKFAPICPDFVIELRSQSDSLNTLQHKMQEYIDNGTNLGWLIDRIQRKVYIYRSSRLIEELDNPTTLSGEPVLPKFVLDLSQVW